jgi:hypothetical protein
MKAKSPKTIREALEQCLELWTELAETGSYDKFRACGKKYAEFAAQCPCCEYDDDKATCGCPNHIYTEHFEPAGGKMVAR